METTNAEISTSEIQKPTESECTFDQKTCDEKFALAKRNLLCGEVPNAVNQLQDVCKRLAAKFGETAPECAEAYFQYGAALLELARMENRVLGNALKGVTDMEGEEPEDSFAVPTIMTEEEKEEISDQVLDAMLESKDEPPATLPDLTALSKISAVDVKNSEVEQEIVAKITDEAQAIESDVKPVGVTEAVDAAEAVDVKKSKVEPESVDKITDVAQAIESDVKPVGVTEAAEAIESEKPESVAEAIGSEVKPKTVTEIVDVAEAMEVKPESIAEPVEKVEASSSAVVSPGFISEAVSELEASADLPEKVAEEDESSDAESMEQDETAEEDTAPEGDVSQNEDEDVSNLQLSWEVLELAKTIYLKQETEDAKFKSAECLKKLGEVGLESEQYSQSIEDFKTSLEILKTCVDDTASDRRLAETHYHIGVSCVNAQLYDDAVSHFSDAISILEAKMLSLNAILNGASGSLESQEEQVADARKELKEIEELIPDIKLKVDDAEEEKRSLVELKKETDCMTKGATVTTGFADSECVSSSSDLPIVQEVKPVSDVSHLVRKKRKPDEESVESEGVKKPKTDEAEVVSKKEDELNTENTESKENVKPADQSDSIDNVIKEDQEKEGKKNESTEITSGNNIEDLAPLKKNVAMEEPLAME